MSWQVPSLNGVQLVALVTSSWCWQLYCLVQMALRWILLNQVISCFMLLIGASHKQRSSLLIQMRSWRANSSTSILQCNIDDLGTEQVRNEEQQQSSSSIQSPKEASRACKTLNTFPVGMHSPLYWYHTFTQWIRGYFTLLYYFHLSFCIPHNHNQPMSNNNIVTVACGIVSKHKKGELVYIIYKCASSWNVSNFKVATLYIHIWCNTTATMYLYGLLHTSLLPLVLSSGWQTQHS